VPKSHDHGAGTEPKRVTLEARRDAEKAKAAQRRKRDRNGAVVFNLTAQAELANKYLKVMALDAEKRELAGPQRACLPKVQLQAAVAHTYGGQLHWHSHHDDHSLVAPT
jgi:hypothetical protein